jgi:hypothetical protein
MKAFLLLLAVLALAACGMGSGPAKTNRVFIRQNGVIVSTYELRGDGKVLRSTTQDRRLGEVVRNYSYDEHGGLASITRESPYARTATIYMASETEKGGGRLSRSTRTVVGGDGASAQAGIQYYYTPEGKLDGMLLTDADGNVQSKAAED